MTAINTSALASATGLPIEEAADIARRAIYATGHSFLELGGIQRLRATLAAELRAVQGLSAPRALQVAWDALA